MEYKLKDIPLLVNQVDLIHPDVRQANLPKFTAMEISVTEPGQPLSCKGQNTMSPYRQAFTQKGKARSESQACQLFHQTHTASHVHLKESDLKE